MAIGDLDDGTRFGLPAIGLPQSHLDTPGSDTQRRAFPGLATKSSVFAWTPDHLPLFDSGLVAPNFTYTINLRQNTAPGGVSVDVPTWAAGCIITCSTVVTVLGTTQQGFTIQSQALGAAFGLYYTTYRALGADAGQVIVPFFDEPMFFASSVSTPAAAGTVQLAGTLLGFIRNV